MKKILLLLVACLGIAMVVFAQEKSAQSGSILFHAINKKDVKANTKTFKSKLNLEAKSISFEVPIESFVFKNGLMQKHFINENNMSTGIFPQAKFVGTITSNTDITKEGRHIVKVEGEMTIKGVTIPFSTNGLISNRGQQTVVNATFLLDGTKFGLDNDKIKGFSDKIEVALNANY